MRRSFLNLTVKTALAYNPLLFDEVTDTNNSWLVLMARGVDCQRLA